MRYDAILTERKFFEERIVSQIQNNSELLKNDGVKVDRVAKNHAIPLSGINLLCEFFKYQSHQKELLDYSIKIAKTKIETARNENLLADLFFEALVSLSYPSNESTISIGYTITEDQRLILHLPTVLKAMEEQKFGTWTKRELMEALGERVLEKKATRELDGTKKDCWIFKCEGKEEN